MTSNDFISQIKQNWLDTNGLVKAQPEWITSGNGVLYSCIAQFLSNDNFLGLNVCKCWKYPGLLMRNPQNTFGQEEFDDYLGIALISILFKLKKTSHDSCWRGPFYLNVPFTWSDFGKSFLLRFPQVWVLMWCAAYPWLKWPLYPLMKLIGLFMNLDPTDAGGVQLSWLYFEGMNLLGFKTKQLITARAMLPKAFSSYYAKNHPFIQFVTETRWS